MAVKIRLRRMGSKKRPFYRLVAADSRRARDGRFIEMLGYYDPLKEPADIKLDDDKIYKWLDRGAKPTENASALLRKAGLLERWQLLKEGVEITKLDSLIEERRSKQPKPKPKTDKKKSVKEKSEKEPPQEEEAEGKTDAAEPDKAEGDEGKEPPKDKEKEKADESESASKEEEPEKSPETAGESLEEVEVEGEDKPEGSAADESAEEIPTEENQNSKKK